MSFILTVFAPASHAGSFKFDTRQQAEDFTSTFAHFVQFGGLGYKIDREIAPLCGWMPDDADRLVIQLFMGRSDKVAPIKFARMKAGCGLKEAKDWIELWFGEFYRSAPRY